MPAHSRGKFCSRRFHRLALRGYIAREGCTRTPSLFHDRNRTAPVLFRVRGQRVGIAERNSRVELLPPLFARAAPILALALRSLGHQRLDAGRAGDQVREVAEAGDPVGLAGPAGQVGFTIRAGRVAGVAADLIEATRHLLIKSGTVTKLWAVAFHSVSVKRKV